MKRCLGAALAVAFGVLPAHAAISTSEANRLAAAARIVQEMRGEIPQEYWNRARCVVVIPDLKKAAFIFGGEYGKGVMSCRAGEQWSAPVFMQLAKGSWGFQAGAEQVDLALLVMNEEGVQKLLSNKVNLGADASVAAGPIGRQGSVSTDAQLTAEILSYSRAQGLFAGINVSGGVLRPDDDSNTDVYGSGASPRTILASREISAPTQAAAFLSALGIAAAASAAPPTTTAQTSTASSEPATPRTTTIGTTDDDIRTRVTQLRQMVDRLLANASPSAVGTSGATTGTTADTSAAGTVTVNRAQLVQLHQQIDALLAALNRR